MQSEIWDTLAEIISEVFALMADETKDTNKLSMIQFWFNFFPFLAPAR